MRTPAEKAEMRERHMAVIAERALLLACDLQEAAMAAADPDQKARLATAFHKVSRGLRQTHYLEVRLERELARQGREDAAEAAKADKALRAERKAHVRSAVERTIWLEYDDDEMQDLVEALDRLLDETAHEAGFMEEPAPTHIARVSAALGLTAAAASDAPLPPADDPAPGHDADGPGFDEAPRRSPG